MSAIAVNRWAQLRLVLHRGLSDQTLASLVLRQGGGREVWDRRLDTVQIPTPPGSPASSSPVLALFEAVVALADSRAELEELIQHIHRTMYLVGGLVDGESGPRS
jgi:hypothetical protein